jgi:hypothetical protein
MQTFPINYLALVVATLLKGLIGWLWYSPLLFLKPWMRLSGMTPELMKQSNMALGLTLETVGNFIMAYVLVHAVHYAGASGPGQGAAVAFFNWLGFIFVVMLPSVTYDRRPLKLVLIHASYQLVGLLVMGAIVATWV